MKEKDSDMCDMMLEENRLKSFKKWPFANNTCMGKEKMAEAGFYFIGNKKEPDLAKCFICLKELDGWEEEDDPWKEHLSHAPYCQFIQLNKKPSELTVKDAHELQMHRDVNIATKFLTKRIEEFKKQSDKTRDVIESLAK